MYVHTHVHVHVQKYFFANFNLAVVGENHQTAKFPAILINYGSLRIHIQYGSQPTWQTRACIERVTRTHALLCEWRMQVIHVHVHAHERARAPHVRVHTRARVRRTDVHARRVSSTCGWPGLARYTAACACACTCTCVHACVEWRARRVRCSLHAPRTRNMHIIMRVCEPRYSRVTRTQMSSWLWSVL